MRVQNKIKKARAKLLGLEHIPNSLDRRITAIESRLGNIEDEIRFVRSKVEIEVQTLPISKDEVLTKIFTDLKMYLNPSDMAVAAHIALDGIWEENITRAWLAVLARDNVVLDIGANFGYYSLLAGQFTDKKKARIVAFEANEDIVPYIQKSASINWLNEQITVENLAVADVEKELVLNVLENYTGSSSLQTIQQLDSYMHDKMRLKLSDSKKVKSVTIDNYCKRNHIEEVNLIKMDIEGYEEKAYRGMGEIIKNSKDVTLFIEFTKDGYEDPENFYNQMLADFGYVYLIDDHGMLTKQTNNSYAAIIGDADDWVMPVFSKNPQLDKVKNVAI
jgi:FkbM family methyltransferase